MIYPHLTDIRLRKKAFRSRAIQDGRASFGLNKAAFMLLLIFVTPSALAQQATTPGVVSAPYPTFEHATVEWAIAGDSNVNSQVSVRFRPTGTTNWRANIPLQRVPAGANEGFAWANRHSGSLFHLSPGTTYEVELSLTDPDGGNTVETLAVTTRALPTIADTASMITVTPSTLGNIVNNAVAGDMVILSPGQYSGFTVNRSGSAGAPIVIRGQPGAEVNGEVGLFGQQHVWLDGLTVNGRIRFNQSDNITITGCHIIASNTAFNGDGIVAFGRTEYAYIADNTVTGTTVWSEAALGNNGDNRGEGIVLTGPGHVIQNNRVSGFRDNISFLEDSEAVDQFSIDVLNNDLSEGADDAIEADFCFHNCRIIENRVTNAFIAFSAQPSLGGPTYFIRNTAYNVVFIAFKLLRGSEGDVLFHNTVVKNGDALGVFTDRDIRRLTTRNNLMIGGSGGSYNGFSSGSGRVLDIPTLVSAGSSLNYDALGSSTGQFSGRLGSTSFGSLTELRNATSQTNAVQVDLSAFAQQLVFPGQPLNRYDPVDLSLSATTPAVDSGIALANINDTVTGTAPDAGALERQLPLPTYGPRVTGRIFADGFE
ncbi:MAG: hypothetical protein AB8B96_09585 [Lysobacterales bacterium]